MEYEQFHGLVIVHPDFLGIPKSMHYRENLSRALEVFYSAGKPIFVARDIISKPSSDIWGELWKVKARTLPIVEPESKVFPTIEEYLKQDQKEVDCIVASIALPRAEIRLAFGGLNAEECVYGFATAYCATVETNYPGLPEPTAKNPIGFGKVFNDIV